MIPCCENEISPFKELLPAIFGLIGVFTGGLITLWNSKIIENTKHRKEQIENKSRVIQDLVYNITFFTVLSGEISLHKSMSNFYKAKNITSDFDSVITEFRLEEYKNRINLLDLKSNISRLCTLYLRYFGIDSQITDFENWLINEFETIEIAIDKDNVEGFNQTIIIEKLSEKLNDKNGIGSKVDSIKTYLNKRIENLK